MLALHATGTPANAAFPGINGRIAYEDDTPDPPEVRVMDQDGTHDTSFGTGREPTWSPDGTRIAYRDGGLWIVNADGSGKHEILADNAAGVIIDPAWSPSADKLAFVREGCQDSGSGPVCSSILNTVNPDGSGETTIVHDQHPHPLEPVWSPSGTKIAFSGGRTSGPGPPGYCYDDIYTVNPDGTGFTTLFGGESDLDLDCSPDWSPDAHALLRSFNHYRTEWISLDGTEGAFVAWYIQYAAWSPDGAKVVGVGAAWNFNPYSIYVMNLDGTSPARLTGLSRIATRPDWQPIPQSYVRPRGASPSQIFLVPAYAQCTSPTRTHGAPLSFDSCAPPSALSSTLTVGTPDANGQPANSVAGVVYAARTGDVAIDATITDVRNRSDLSDYSGELQLVTDVRITDRDNTPNPGGPGPGTVEDTPLAVTVPCAATADARSGSSCDVSTTVDALFPGAITSGQRSIWQLGQVKARDGGSDGLASTTADNTLFLNQGIFVP